MYAEQQQEYAPDVPPTISCTTTPVWPRARPISWLSMPLIASPVRKIIQTVQLVQTLSVCPVHMVNLIQQRGNVSLVALELLIWAGVVLHVLRVVHLAPVRLLARHVLLLTIFWERFVRLLVRSIWFPMELSARLAWLYAVSVTRLPLCALFAMQEYTFTTTSVLALAQLLLSPVLISSAVSLKKSTLLSS